LSDTIKFAFILTGVERDFTSLAASRVRSLVNRWRNAGDDARPFDRPARVRFVHFSFETRDIRVYEHPFPEKGSVTPFAKKLKGWQALATFASDTGTTEENPTTFVDPTVSMTVDNQPALSITNLYHSVRGAPADSVLAVEIFSHGWVEGPTLVNTFEDPTFAAMDPPQRTPTDMDGRTSTDFLDNMGEDPAIDSSGLAIKKGGKDALTQFIQGFDPEAHLRVYGCDVQDIINFEKSDGTVERNIRVSTAFQVIHQAYAIQLRMGGAIAKALRAKKDPGVDLTLDMGQEFRNEETNPDRTHYGPPHTAAELRPIHYSIDPTFFDDVTQDKISKPLSKIVGFVARQVEESYVFKAAEQLADKGVVCHGSVPGTGGEFEKGKPKIEEGIDEPLMRVCRAEGFGCSKTESYATWLSFYEGFVKMTVDERNYGFFDKATVEALDTLSAQ
jgi:hypothetical protein